MKRELAQKRHVNPFRLFFKSPHTEALRFKLALAVHARMFSYSSVVSCLLVLFPFFCNPGMQTCHCCIPRQSQRRGTAGRNQSHWMAEVGRTSQDVLVQPPAGHQAGTAGSGLATLNLCQCPATLTVQKLSAYVQMEFLVFHPVLTASGPVSGHL